MKSEKLVKLRRDIEEEIAKEERIMHGALKLREALDLNEEMSEVMIQKSKLSLQNLKKMLEDLNNNQNAFQHDAGTSDEADLKPLKERISLVVSSELEQHYKKLLDQEKEILGGFERMRIYNDLNKGTVSEKQFRENIDLSKSKIRKYQMIIKREEVQKLKNKLDHEKMLNPGLYHNHVNSAFPKYTFPKLFERNHQIIEYRIGVMKTLLSGCEKMTMSISHKKTREKLKLAERNIRERLDLLEESFSSFKLNRQPIQVDRYHLNDLVVTGTFMFKLVGVSNLATTIPNRDPNKPSLAMNKEPKNLMRSIMKGSKTSESGLVNFKIFIDNRLILNTSWIKPHGFNNEDGEDIRVKLEDDRQLIVEVFYNDYRSLCGIGFLPLCEFIDSGFHLVRLPLEPSGEVYFRASYQDPIEMKVGIKRGKHIFVRTGFQTARTSKVSAGIETTSQRKLDLTKGPVSFLPSPSKNLSFLQPVEPVSPETKSDFVEDAEVSSSLASSEPCIEDFEVLRLVGKGCFGAVFRVRHKEQGLEAALKVISKGEIVNQNEIENFIVERDVLLEVSTVFHPFLVQMYCCFQDEYCLYFLMNFMKGGDLLNYIVYGWISDEGVRFYSGCVILALEFLHNRNIAYRDLKLENIMMDTDGYIKLTDFGLCKMNMTDDSVTTTFCGTPSFMAPEIVMHKPYTKCVDWWSFGVLLYEMYYSTDPFDPNGDDEEREKVYDNIINMDPHYGECGDPIILNLMQTLLIKNPNDRLGYGPKAYEKVKNHRYYMTLDFEKLYHKKLQPPLKLERDKLEDDSYFDESYTTQTPLISAVVKQIFLTDNDQKYFTNFDVSVRMLESK